MTSDQAYVYSSLPTKGSIRLLRRIGVGADGILEFTFKVVDLEADVTEIDQIPQYHGLSYTWGNPHATGRGFEKSYEAFAPDYSQSERKSIRCDGKILSVEHNLLYALSEISTEGWVRRIINRPQPETKRTLLFDRVALGNSQLVRSYIGQGANVHATDQFERTPLHEAAINGHLECAKMLIKGGSDIGALDKDGKTPETHARERSYFDVANMLKKCSDEGIDAVCRDVKDFYPFGPDDFIWIDAICINQEDLVERTAQLKIMGSIYDNARYVLVWLGRADEYTAGALETISKLESSVQNFANSRLVPFRPQTPEEYETAGVPYISLAEWDSLAAFFLRQWFRRIWAVQEVAFATGIQMFCGTTEFSWSKVTYIVDLLRYMVQQNGYESSTIYVPLEDVASSVEYFANIMSSKLEARRSIMDGSREVQNVEQFSLDQLIITTFPFKCTDPRDKIYALLPLSNLHSRGSFGIVPDYSQTVENCYANATKCIINGKRDFRFLSFVQEHSIRELKTLPSWVPDYSLRGVNPIPWRNFHASGDLSFDGLPEHAAWDELLLKGWQYDVIDRTANARARGTNGKAKYELDDSWFDLILTMDISKAYPHSGQPVTEVLWRTLCFDHGNDFEHPAPPEYDAMFKKYVCALVCAEPEGLAREEERTRENAITLGGLMHTALKMQNEVASGSQGPDEAYMASLRERLPPIDRTLASSFMDGVRPALAKLEKLAGNSAIPTLLAVEEYFRDAVNPIRRPDGIVEIPADILPYVHSHAGAYGWKRLFATKKGYLGLGPASLEVGDSVWIIPNSEVPFVMRPLGNDDAPAAANSKSASAQRRRFNFIGEAYVHGIMHGEAVEAVTGEGAAEEIILV